MDPLVHEARTPLVEKPYSASTRRHLWKYWTRDWISHAPKILQTNIDSVLGLALNVTRNVTRASIQLQGRPISGPISSNLIIVPRVVANTEVHEPCHQQLPDMCWMDDGLVWTGAELQSPGRD